MTEVIIISNKNDEWLKRDKNEVIMMKCIKEVGIMGSEDDQLKLMNDFKMKTINFEEENEMIMMMNIKKERKLIMIM